MFKSISLQFQFDSIELYMQKLKVDRRIPFNQKPLIQVDISLHDGRLASVFSFKFHLHLGKIPILTHIFQMFFFPPTRRSSKVDGKITRSLCCLQGVPPDWAASPDRAIQQWTQSHSWKLFVHIFCNMLITPQKSNMEPEHHTFEKENHLPKLHFFSFHVSFPGYYMH